VQLLLAIALTALSLCAIACECDPRIAACEEITAYGDDLVTVEPSRGWYREKVSVQLSSRDGREIVYSLDGSLPSIPYEGPIEIGETTMVRAAPAPRSRGEGVATHTFIIGEARPLPIVSIGADRASLEDPDTGIHSRPLERGEEWERPVSFELLWPDGSSQIDVGLRLHGGGSRRGNTKRSYKIYFRDVFGERRIDRDLFGAGPPSSDLVLRGGYNDAWHGDRNQRPNGTLIRDQVVRDLHREIGYPSSRGVFVELYVSGESTGIYNLVERIDESWCEANIGSGGAGFDVVSGNDEAEIEVRAGDDRAWRELLSFAKDDRFIDAGDASEIERRVDLESFFDYIALNVWIQNHDWPYHNWYAARPRTEGGKWLFFPWDSELSLGLGTEFVFDKDTVERARNVNQGPMARVFFTLLESPRHRAMFIERLRALLSNQLSAEHVALRFSEAARIVEPAIEIEAQIWGGTFSDLPALGPADWRAAVDRVLSTFIPNRGQVVLSRLPQPVPAVHPRRVRRVRGSGSARRRSRGTSRGSVRPWGARRAPRRRGPAS
jgi:hypothetical protein